jgi:hypothetical protein
MRNLILLITLILCPGCFGSTLKLEPQFSPLTEIVEAPGKVIPSHTITTIDETSYVTSLPAFLADYPPGSIQYTAILMHEREHVIRENAFPGGTPAWLAKYLADRSFRWQEEKAGWKIEILYNYQHGMFIDAAEIAAALNQNYRFGGRMVSYAEAYQWVLDVMTGKQ